MNLPDKITNPELKKQLKERLLETHGKYIAPNHIDNFCLMAVPEVLNKLMNVVVNMTGTELTENDWWIKGFYNNELTSSHCPDHEFLKEYARQITEEVYNENSKRG